MIAIDWIFVGGASGIVGVALLDKLAEEYGFRWLGGAIRAILHVGAIGAGLALCDVIAEVFLQ